MFAVIFEVKPKSDRWDDYLGYAKMLRPEIEKIDGFIDVERFSSKRREGWVLSLSIWRDEKALIRWRTLAVHHQAQEKGRAEIFADYRLRVGEIVADTQAPQALPVQRLDETEVGDAKAMTITERRLAGAPVADPSALAAQFGLATQPSLVDWDVFESIYQPGKFVLLRSWRDADAAAACAPGNDADRHRRVRIVRDYGMFAREEAPQYYPPVQRPAG